MDINSLLLTDFYKVEHVFQYPEGTNLVYSNLTARKSRLPTEHMVFFGLQYFCLEYLQGHFKRHFFDRPLNDVIAEYRLRVKTSLGQDLQSYEHIKALHSLGYLPVKIKAVREGTRVPIRVPCLTIVNTLPKFFWVTNFLETIMSAVLWQPCTSATIASLYRDVLDGFAERSGMPAEFVPWQGHDFSFRGMGSPESGLLSGMGHLTSFTGTDTIPAIDGMERYYAADAGKELIGGSIPATEHSVMCAGGDEGERETFERLISKVYPNGLVAIVSDTWDLWSVLTEHMVALKENVMARNGKVVIRPDSGDPVKIICGDPESSNWAARKGVIELLWDTYGGTVSERGYRILDSHVGAIYGDSITLDRAKAICDGLLAKGFASQCVFGIGSYTYQHNTRDTLGMAVKATYCEINGAGREIFKNPKTDDGTKKSAKGLLRVDRDISTGELVLHDQQTWEQESGGILETVFVDGQLIRRDSLASIRQRIRDRV